MFNSKIILFATEQTF